MKKYRKVWKIVFTVLALCTGLCAYAQSTWKADTGSAKITFTTGSPFGQVKGSLAGLRATIVFDENNPGSGSMSASVDPLTIKTGIALRDKHLKEKEEFFQPSIFPLIAFKSNLLKKTSTGYEVSGNLTIKAVTRWIQIPFTFQKTEKGAIFKGQFTLDAYDYSLGTSSKPVTVYLEIPVSN
jgi:polyisoprenoid-binding protein YceI